MHPRSALHALAALACIFGPVNAKPEPDAVTLKFITACIREYACSADFETSSYARHVRQRGSRQEWQDYAEARRDVHASRQYLHGLSQRTFRRHLDDAMYLTTPRSPARCAVAYVAAMRGVDVSENCARMNDALRPSHRPTAPWENAIVERVRRGGYLAVDTDPIPYRLVSIYSRHPNDRILCFLFHPSGQAGCECGNDAIASLTASHPKEILRFAKRNIGNLRILTTDLSRDIDPYVRMRLHRAFVGIMRSGGPLASSAGRCLAATARWDAIVARQRNAAQP